MSTPGVFEVCSTHAILLDVSIQLVALMRTSMILHLFR